MRDLIVLVAFIAAITAFLAIGCGTASAQTAESPNYQLEYLDEGTTAPPADVQGEVEFQQTPEQGQPAQTNQLPATNPPYVLIGSAVAAIAIAVVAYYSLK